MQDTSAHAYRFAILLGMLTFVSIGGTYMSDYARVLGDPDTFWHVKLGSDIISSGHLPTVDTYSHSYAGKPFVSKEWLSEVLLALSYKFGGWNGVLVITSLAAVSAVLLLYRQLAQFLRPTMAGLSAISFSIMLSPVVLARPHVFTMPIAAYFTARLFRAAEAKQAPQFWLLGLVTLWANLHGSFTLSFVIAGFAFLHLLENVRLTDKPLLVKWCVFLVLCPLASMIHPYGYEPIRIGATMMATNKAMAYIVEWMPLDPQVQTHSPAHSTGSDRTLPRRRSADGAPPPSARPSSPDAGPASPDSASSVAGGPLPAGACRWMPEALRGPRVSEGLSLRLLN